MSYSLAFPPNSKSFHTSEPITECPEQDVREEETSCSLQRASCSSEEEQPITECPPPEQDDPLHSEDVSSSKAGSFMQRTIPPLEHEAREEAMSSSLQKASCSIEEEQPTRGTGYRSK